MGKSIAADLNSLGIRNVEDLQRKDPQALYETLCELQHMEIDRCVLYVFRCAVYYAENLNHDQELLKWWNWKDIKGDKKKEKGRKKQKKLTDF